MVTNDDSSVPASISQSTYVYFISAGSTPIKIGLSNDPAARLADLQTAHYQRLHLLYTIECKSRAQAFELESAFHRWYGEVHIRNEWYNLTPKQITEDVRLLVALAHSVINVMQHVTAEHISLLETKAERKTLRANLLNVPVEQINGVFFITCPQCGMQLQRDSELGAKRALNAHMKKHRNEERAQ